MQLKLHWKQLWNGIEQDKEIKLPLFFLKSVSRLKNCN